MLDKTLDQAFRDVAADVEFVEDIGSSPQAFIVLLDGIDVQWGDDCSRWAERLGAYVERPR
jgi:hypothetical protein